MAENVINVALGFATGRKQFQKTLRSYIYNWLEIKAQCADTVILHLFISYDLSYDSTEKKDFTHISHDILEHFQTVTFLGKEDADLLMNKLISSKGPLSADIVQCLFGKGYAAQRNLILYSAIRKKMDYLLYLDDDEYPLANTKIGDSVVWCGEPLLPMHLSKIKNADMTCGLHCGYVSPIPHIEFNDCLNEGTFRRFIFALSNDIINWENLKHVMQNNGVTYADPHVLRNRRAIEVPEINHAKLFTGVKEAWAILMTT